MILPDQTPKLPKWPFLASDVALLAAAWLVAAESPQPLSADAILAIACCVIFAAVVGAIPFLADYARRQDEALDNRQRSLEKLARDATEAAEQISIAAATLHDVARAARQGLSEAGELPARLQAQIADFSAQAAKGRTEERKALERELASVTASIAGKLEEAASRVTLASSEWVRLAQAEKARETEVPKVPVEPAAQTPAPVAREILPASEPPVDLLPGPKGEAPPVRKRAPRKPPVEVQPAPEAATAVEAQAPAAPSEFTQAAPDEIAPPVSISADGASRLLVTAYIGIGNRLFIRGEGPGLSWERGVPLQFVSIGKWRWDTSEATAPITFKLYKNDEIECSALGTGSLEPGQQREVTASF